MKTLLIGLFLWCSLGGLLAQETLEEKFHTMFIPLPKPDECYTRCWVSDVIGHRVVYKDVLLLEDNRHFLDLIGDYELVKERVLVHPAGKTIEIEPPKLEERQTEKTYYIEPKTELVELPATVGDTLYFEKMATPIRYGWVPYVKDKASCINIDTKHCVLWCYKEIPALYLVESKIIVEEDGQLYAKTLADTITIPNKYTHVKRPYLPIEKEVLPMYQVITKIIPKQPLSEEAAEQVTYSTIFEAFVEKKYSYLSEWEKVDCIAKSDKDFIEAIKVALHKKGYKVTLNDKFDEPTKTALIKFQKDNNIPPGYLDVLKALEIETE